MELVPQHGKPEVESSSKYADEFVSTVAKIVLQDSRQIRLIDTAAVQLTAILVLRKVRFTSIHFHGVRQRSKKTPVFERMKRIVMDKDRKRPLRRQHTSCPSNDFL
jgi:hypothetical protein